MTTKQTAVLTTSIQTEAVPAVKPVPVAKPQTLSILELTEVAYEQAAVHVRAGYKFIGSMPPESFPQTGYTKIHLELGTPADYAVTAAAVTSTAAIAAEAAAYKADVEKAAAALVAETARAAKQAELAVELEDARKALAKVQRAIASNA